MAWLTLTDRDNREVLVNMDLVVRISRREGEQTRTRLLTIARAAKGSRTIYVQEDLSEIARLLDGLGVKVKPPSR